MRINDFSAYLNQHHINYFGPNSYDQMTFPSNYNQAQIDEHMRAVRAHDNRIQEAISMIRLASTQAIEMEIEIVSHNEEPGEISSNLTRRATNLIQQYGNLITGNHSNRNQS